MKKFFQFIQKVVRFLFISAIVIFFVWEVGVWLFYKSMFGSAKFDSFKWNETSVGMHGIVNDYSSYRCAMYEDLVNNHLKVGMKLEEVVKVMGDSRMKSYCTNKSVKCLEYELGSCVETRNYYSNIMLGSYNHIYMGVCFDKNNNMISVGKNRPCAGKGKYNYVDEVVCGKKENVIGCHQDKCWDRDIDGKQKEVDFKQW